MEKKILILWQSEAEGKEGVEGRMHPSKACVSLRDPLPATGLTAQHCHHFPNSAVRSLIYHRINPLTKQETHDPFNSQKPHPGIEDQMFSTRASGKHFIYNKH